VIALLNLAVAVYIHTLGPEFLYRLICWALARRLYRLKKEGPDHIPAQGPAVWVCNHVTYVDRLILAGASQRPERFVMHCSFLKIPLTGRNTFRSRIRLVIGEPVQAPQVRAQRLQEILGGMPGDTVAPEKARQAGQRQVRYRRGHLKASVRPSRQGRLRGKGPSTHLSTGWQTALRLGKPAGDENPTRWRIYGGAHSHAKSAVSWRLPRRSPINLVR
jgi:hypothetical protein